MTQKDSTKIFDLSIDSPCFDCLHNENCMLEDILGNSDTSEVEHNELIYSKGDLLIKQGTIAPHVIFVKEGMVKIFLEHRDRKQVLCVEKGGFVGLESMYNDKFFQYSVSAVSDVKVCLIEIESFKAHVEKDALFAAKIIRHINLRSKNLYKRIITLTQKQAHARVADILICFIERIFGTTTYQLPFTRKELAEMTTLSVESLSRILKEFKNEGVVNSEGRNFEILDVDKLQHISNVG